MTGKLLIRDGLEATLGDDLRWSCADAVVAAYLNARFPPSHSPALGAAGRAAVIEAAEVLGCKAEFPPDAPEGAPPGTAY